MRTNFILIDSENVQPTSLAGLDAEHFRVLIFVGASQTKLNFEVAAALQRFGSRGEYVKISGNGCNALDFHIAYYIGLLSEQDPTACFHIISKDKGFDPLIRHLKERKVSAARSESIADIPLLKRAHAKTITEMLAAVVTNLQQRGTSKPRTVKTLTGTINSLLQKQLSQMELEMILNRLQTEGTITINGTKVTYAPPPIAPVIVPKRSAACESSATLRDDVGCEAMPTANVNSIQNGISVPWEDPTVFSGKAASRLPGATSSPLEDPGPP